MMDDQQTHTLPKDPAGLERVAAFLGYPDLAAFEAAFFGQLRRVEAAYSELFEQAPSLSGPGDLVFTGGEPEAATLETLAGLGFRDGKLVFDIGPGLAPRPASGDTLDPLAPDPHGADAEPAGVAWQDRQSRRRADQVRRVPFRPALPASSSSRCFKPTRPCSTCWPG